jgi:hypothetical protein
MDKVSLYRQYIQELLTELANWRCESDPIVSETIFDTLSDRYQLVNVGWKDGSTPHISHQVVEVGALKVGKSS